jgi:hypothetical protein
MAWQPQSSTLSAQPARGFIYNMKKIMIEIELAASGLAPSMECVHARDGSLLHIVGHGRACRGRPGTSPAPTPRRGATVVKHKNYILEGEEEES